MEIEIKTGIEHLAEFFDVYKYVLEGEKDISGIKAYLMEQYKKKETTARRITERLKSIPGMFAINDSKVSIDKSEMSNWVINLINCFGLNVQKEAEEENRKIVNEIQEENTALKTQIYELNHKLEERDQELHRQKEVQELLEKEKAASREEIVESKKINKQLECQIIELEMDCPVKVMGPEIWIENANGEKKFSEEIEFFDTTWIKSVTGGMRTDFYDVEEINKDDDKLLNQKNFDVRTTKTVFTENYKRQIEKATEEEKISQGKSKKTNLNYHNQIEQAEISKKEIARERMVYFLLENNLISDNEKLIIYAGIAYDKNPYMKKVLSLAADKGIDALWTIKILEEQSKLTDYNQLEKMLTAYVSDSAFRRKLELARELIAGDWKIEANYNGKITRFALVPVDEICEIRKRINMDEFKLPDKKLLKSPEQILEDKREEATIKPAEDMNMYHYVDDCEDPNDEFDPPNESEDKEGEVA